LAANAGAGCISAAASGGNCGRSAATFVGAYALGRGLDALTPNGTLYDMQGESPTSVAKMGRSDSLGIGGVLNNLSDAKNNLNTIFGKELDKLGQSGVGYLLDNPTTGIFGDLIESAQDVLGSGTKISRQLQGILEQAQVDGFSVNIFAHSQGGAISASALGRMASMKGLSINLAGAAANRNTFVQLGIPIGAWKADPFDAVPMIFGRNGNPLQMLGSAIASPLLFMGCQASPHSSCNYGGAP